MTKTEALLVFRTLQLIAEGKPLPDDPYDLLDDPVEKFNARLRDTLGNTDSVRTDRERVPGFPRLGIRGPYGQA